VSKSIDAIVTPLITAAVLGWLAATTMPPGVLRAALALPLVLVLPGYALIRAVHRPLLNGIAGACFSVGLSMASAIGAGYVLNVFDAMTPFGWASALAAVTLVPTIMTARTGAADSGSPLPDVSSIGALFYPASHVRMAMVAVALATSGAAYAVASDGVMTYREFKYTELWVAPEGLNRNDRLQAGIRNMEGRPATYNLEIRFDGKLISQWNSIPLADGQDWTKSISVPLDTGQAKRAEVRLFKSDNPGHLYRQAWLSVPHQ
jgi:uncharacterized membrane protein